MKVLLCAFSGTGNTMIATHKLASFFEQEGHEVTIYPVTRPYENIPDPNEYDVIGLGYPIHAFNAPQIFVRFCKRLPKVENKKTFFYKTSGEPFRPNNASSFFCYKALKKKGYHCIMDVHMLMPYNIMFRYKDGLAKQMYIYTKATCKLIVKRILNGEEDKLRYNIFTIIWALMLRLQWFGAWILGPTIHAKKKLCTKCGACVAKCPSHNIKMTEKGPKFGWRCTMCMSCAFRCPQDAVRPGFLNPWRVNGLYPYAEVLKDKEKPSVYITEETKGYFKLFLKYYQKLDTIFASYGITIDEDL